MFPNIHNSLLLGLLGSVYAIPWSVITLIGRDQLYSKLHSYIDSTFGTPAPEEVLLIEVGPSDAFDKVHLKNAIHMTLDEVETNSQNRLPDHGAEIVIYGQDRASSEPRQAIQILDRRGYCQIYYYPDGKEDWIHAGLEVQYSLVPADNFQYNKSSS
jgi:rhodanese-related sulfurtransferase